jgi:hypothetical protein
MDVSLSLAPELTENIRRLAFNGLNALPRRGVEIGGLIARPKQPGAPADELLLVPCEHLFGPSYHLSENDLQQLRMAAETCGSNGHCAAAYFRSCTRLEDEVDTDDERAIAETCPDIPAVVLAHPSPNGSARIRLFRREPENGWTIENDFTVFSQKNGSPVAENPAAHDPAAHNLAAHNPAAHGRAAKSPVASNLVASDLKLLEIAQEIVLRQPASITPNPTLPLLGDHAPQPVAVNSAPERPIRPATSTWSRPGILWPLIAGILVLAAQLLFVVRKKVIRPVQPSMAIAAPSTVPASVVPPSVVPENAPSVDTSVGLTVRPEGGQLHLTWNRKADAVRSARSGLLNIDDGATPVSIVLGPPDLKLGSVLYTAHSQDVRFRLRLSSPSGESAEEAIRIVHGSFPAQKANAANPVVKAPQEAAVPKAGIAAAAAPVLENKSTAPGVSGAPTRLPPTEWNASPSPRPVVTSGVNRPAESSPQSPGPQAPAAQTTRDVPPAVPNVAPPAGKAPATVPGGETAPPAPATPLRQVRPSFVASRWNVPETTKIVIIVSVDNNGKVTEARSGPENSGKSLYLINLSQEAARQWTFKPASLQGRPVASTSRIEFVFAPR